MGNFEQKVAEAVRREMNDPRLLSRNRHGSTPYGGRVFFVLKAAATNYTQFVEDHPDYRSGDGVVTVAAVYNTVDAAIGACTAAQGDVIYVMPGHTETVTSTSIAMDISGVSVICLGNGLNRPVFTYGAAAATITVSAANMSFTGGHHIGNFLDVAAAFTIGAGKDFKLEKNTFVDNSSSLGFLSIVVTGATDNDADGLTVAGNYWQGLDVSPNAFVSILAAEKRVLLEDNDVFKDATNDAGQFVTLSSKIMTGFICRRNRLIVVGATGTTVGIFLTGSGTTSTGVVYDNFCASLDTTTELMFTAGTGLKYFRNEYTGVADKSGYIVPAIDSAA